jgi:hypothetical protein
LILDIAQTVLTFVGAPAAVIAVVAILVYAGSGKSRAKRYRPGRSFDSAPVWYTSSAHPHGPSDGRALESSSQAVLPATAGTASAPGVTGGASDRW